MWLGLVARVGYWYVLFIICYLLTVLLVVLLSVVAENGLKFGDKLWPSDDDVAPNDGVCGSRI
jgi:hypothetical protein